MTRADALSRLWGSPPRVTGKRRFSCNAGTRHAGEISVTVPTPERYAVHKLIVANERTEREKQAKDLIQTGFLIEALARNQPVALTATWVEAWNRGPSWRRHLEADVARLDETGRIAMTQAVCAHGGMLGYEPTQIGFPASPA